VPSFGAVRLGNATGLGLIVIWSALGLALTALGLALGFGAEIGAALATGWPVLVGCALGEQGKSFSRAVNWVTRDRGPPDR
jgi:hypothetical protein